MAYYYKSKSKGEKIPLEELNEHHLRNIIRKMTQLIKKKEEEIKLLEKELYRRFPEEDPNAGGFIGGLQEAHLKEE